MNERFNSQPFLLDEDGLCHQLESILSPRMRDLLQIAMKVYVADRLTKRNGRADYDGPSRFMPPLTVGVSDVGFWSSNTVRLLLERAISFVTDDQWEFSFVKQAPAPQQRPLLLPPPDPTLVCLYSGGLDSAAGLANRLREWNGEVLAVTAQHQAGQTRLVRKRQLPRLRRQFGNRIASIMVRTALRKPPPMNQQELTQRSRSFLFTALGGAVALGAGVDSVEVYENGVGIINLPVMAGMLVGGRATKSAHPEFFHRMSTLVSAVADRPIEFVLPFRNKTKAQLVSVLASNDDLTKLAQDSVSCVHYPRRIAGSRKQCGVCPGCIGRRQALTSAGIHEPATNYAFDIFGDKVAVETIPTHKLDHLKATIIQIELLCRVDHDQPLPLAVRTHLAGILKPTEDSRPAIRVLQEYRQEWLRLIEAGLRTGRHWASWHGPISPSRIAA